MLDITPGKGAGANWALGGSHAPSRNWGAHKDKTGKTKALKVKMGDDGSTKHLAKTYKRGEARFKGVSHQTDY